MGKEDLNADEAPALGAAFRAANPSSTFRVRAVGMDDVTPFAVGVRLKDLRPTEGEEKPFKKRGSLFEENNHLFRRRAVTLKHAKDLKVELFYEKSSKLPMDTSRDLGYYEIAGIDKAIAKYMNNEEKYNITELPKVSLSFLLDANGQVDLVAATATFTEWVTEEKEVKKSTDKSKKDKDKSKDKEEEKEEKEESGKDSEDSEKEKDDSNKSDAEKTDESQEKEEDKKEDDEEEEAKEVEMVSRKRTHR